MTIEGRLLFFEKLLMNDHYFSNDCKINYPEKVPLVWNMRFFDPECIIGISSVTQDNDGLVMSAELFHKDFLDKRTLIELSKVGGLGGYYSKVKCHYDDENNKVVDEADLKCCSIVLSPADKDCAFSVKEDIEEDE